LPFINSTTNARIHSKTDKQQTVKTYKQ